MKRVLFVNAIDPLSEVENRYRPLWPAYLAAFAEKSLGTDKLEFRFMSGSFQNELHSFRPHVVALSAVSQNYNHVKTYARIAREQGLSVIAGGMHISNLPQCLTTDMDVGCIGEGEVTFSELMQHYLEFGRFSPDDLGSIKGIVYYKKGKLVTTPSRSLHQLDKLPHPKRSLIGYQSHDYMFTSRGCPYQCSFCASTRYWAKVRWASAEYVIEEMRELIENGVKTISFYDDIFIANKKRLQQIAASIIANGFNRQVKFTCSARANTVTPEAVDLLKSMNMVSVGLGLESGNDRILRYLKGRVTVENNLQAVNLLKDAGIQANASFIIGSPDETEAEIMDTYNFIKNSRLDFFDLYVLTPLPGTETWAYASRRNLISDDMDWSLLNVNFEVHPEKALILSETLSRRQLLRLYKKFRRLRLVRIIKALPGSPWVRDLPGVAIKVLIEKLGRIIRTLRISRSGVVL